MHRVVYHKTHKHPPRKERGHQDRCCVLVSIPPKCQPRAFLLHKPTTSHRYRRIVCVTAGSSPKPRAPTHAWSSVRTNASGAVEPAPTEKLMGYPAVRWRWMAARAASRVTQASVRVAYAMPSLAASSPTSKCSCRFAYASAGGLRRRRAQALSSRAGLRRVRQR